MNQIDMIDKDQEAPSSSSGRLQAEYAMAENQKTWQGSDHVSPSKAIIRIWDFSSRMI